MGVQCSYDAIVDLSALNLDDFIQDNISEAVEQMEKAQKDGDFSYVCQRIQSTVQGLKKSVAKGRKDSAAKTVKTLHNAVRFLEWGIKHHIMELRDGEGNLLPWVGDVLDLLNFMSECHMDQEALTAQQVQQLYDMADLFRKFADLTDIKFELSDRLLPPHLGGEGVHVRLMKKNGHMTGCSDAEYFKHRVQNLSKESSFGNITLKAIIVFAVGTALVCGAAFGWEYYHPGANLEVVKVLSPAVGGVLAFLNFLFNLRASKSTSSYYQGTLAEIYNEWLNSPSHGTNKPLDSEFSKITGIQCDLNGQFLVGK